MNNRRLNWSKVFWTFIISIGLIIAADCIRRDLVGVPLGDLVINGKFKNMDEMADSSNSITILGSDTAVVANDGISNLGYCEFNISNQQIYTGSLCVINSMRPASGNFDGMIKLSDIKNEFYTLRSDELVMNDEAANQLNAMMSDYNQATGLSNFTIYNTTLTNDDEYSIYTNVYPEAVSGYSFDAAILSSSGDTIEYDGMDTESWLIDNCSRYGFVLRYDAAKQSSTGVDASKYHFRYVGNVHSAIMKEQNMCLEEYMDYLKMVTSYAQPLMYTLDGVNYEIYYNAADLSMDSTNITIPVSGEYNISGNNYDGFIVTAIKK